MSLIVSDLIVCYDWHVQSRQRDLNTKPVVGAGACVVYVMSRDQRVQDNQALVVAQQQAITLQLPLVVYFGLLSRAGVRAREHFAFMVAGLREVATELEALGIGFEMRMGDYVEELQSFLQSVNPAVVYFDFNPLRFSRGVQQHISAWADCRCVVVDTHNVVPVWVASDKQEFAAHTLRRKIHRQLETYVRMPEKVRRHPFMWEGKKFGVDWEAVERLVDGLASCGISVEFVSGTTAGLDVLGDFIQHRLRRYALERNDPNAGMLSGLSPYLHFGQVSSLRVALEVMAATGTEPLLFREARMASAGEQPSLEDGMNALLEELIVRKELADNFCYYNDRYDVLSGGPDWGLKTLDDHREDAREYVYDRERWERAETHDVVWNAAQRELLQTGKIHGYMRMYWAKKILEWSVTPEAAIETAVYLNDHYSIDGGDPNGYVGILWSLTGLHDRPWQERAVFGKVRYMNAAGLQRKFDTRMYVVGSK